MRKKIYVILCVATCLMFATACGNKKSGDELTTSAYNDTVSDMEKTTEASSDATDDTDSTNSSTEKTTADSSSTEATTKDSSSSTENSSDASNTTTATTDSSEATTSEEDITAEGDENFEEPTTATKENEKESWASSGTLSGFVDNNSVEIVMSDGSVRTFFVYDEEISTKLQNLLESGEEETIDFVYQPIAGQANSQITELK